MAKLPTCSCCGEKPAQVLFKDGRSAEDWLLASCDTCLELVCEDCQDVDDSGKITCTDCIQTAKLLREEGTP